MRIGIVGIWRPKDNGKCGNWQTRDRELSKPSAESFRGRRCCSRISKQAALPTPREPITVHVRVSFILRGTSCPMKTCKPGAHVCVILAKVGFKTLVLLAYRAGTPARHSLARVMRFIIIPLVSNICYLISIIAILFICSTYIYNYKTLPALPVLHYMACI